MQLSTKEKIFSIIIAIYPMLAVYRSPIRSVDLGTLVLIVFFIFASTKTVYINEISWLILYIFIQTPLVLLASINKEVSSTVIILRYGKLIISLGIVFVLGMKSKFYREDYTIHVIKIVCYISAVFIIIQRIFFIFGIVIKNPLLAYATDEGYISGYSMITAGLFRPSAFFLEPAHLSLYAIVYLCYSLFEKDEIKEAIVVSIAILCTGSGIGLIAVLGAFVAYVVIRFKDHILKVLGILLVGLSTILYFSQTLFFVKVINRLNTDNLDGGGNAINARVGIGYQIFSEKKIMNKIFGSGYGNVPEKIYLNGATYILNTLGFVGIFLFFYILLKILIKGKLWQKMGIAILAILVFFSQIFTPSSLVFYLCVYKSVYSLNGDSKQKEN